MIALQIPHGVFLQGPKRENPLHLSAFDLTPKAAIPLCEVS